MTKACKCDRCGNLFDIRENDTRYRIEKYEGDREYEELDLCDACMYALEKFMDISANGTTISHSDANHLINDIPGVKTILLKDKPLEMRFAGYSPHDCESKWICPNPDCDHVYGSWWFYNKKLHAHDTFLCEGCHSLLEVPEEEI